VTVPVVYVEGTNDKLLEPGWSNRMSAATPGSRAITAPFSHEPNIDAPGALTELLVQLFEEAGDLKSTAQRRATTYVTQPEQKPRR
jgi:hypothetical protein